MRVFLCIASPLRYLQNLNWILKSLTNQSRYSETETQKRGNQNVPTNFYFSAVQYVCAITLREVSDNYVILTLLVSINLEQKFTWLVGELF